MARRFLDYLNVSPFFSEFEFGIFTSDAEAKSSDDCMLRAGCDPSLYPCRSNLLPIIG